MPAQPLCRLLYALLLIALTLPASYAQTLHAPLPTSPELDFNTLLEHALAYAPEARETAVRAQQAEDVAATGRSWIAGRPSIALNYYNDGPLDNRGQVETEYGVQVPLWRPGERQGSALQGERYREQLALWEHHLRLNLAGRLRGVLADIQQALALLELEREASVTAAELVAATNLLFEAGALARLDVMQAESLLLEQRQRELQAEALLVDSERAYTVLTGLEIRPQSRHAEMQSQVEEIAAEHPLLRYLQSDIDLADSAVVQNEIAAKGSPQLTLGSRRERGDRFTPYTDSVNVALTIPIGGGSFVSAGTSAARRAKVDAEVLYINTRRALEQQLHEVEHGLFVVNQALPLAEQQAALGAQRRTMAQTAFEQGELTLAQALPAIQEARLGARELAMLRLRQQRLISEFNQLIGVLP